MVTKFQYTAVLEYMCFYLFLNYVDIIISGIFLLLFSVHKVLCNRESNGDLSVHGHIVWVPHGTQCCKFVGAQVRYSVRAPGAWSDRVRSMYNTISITHERRTESLDKHILSTHCFKVEPEHQVCNRLWILKPPKLRISYSPAQDTSTTVLNRVRALPQNHLIFEKETKKQFTITIKKCKAKHENTMYNFVDIRYRYLLYDKE